MGGFYILIPWLHHPNNRSPSKCWAIYIRLHNPMQIAHSMLYNTLEIHLDQNIGSQALTRFLDQRYLQLTQYLTSSSITTKQIFRSYLVNLLRQIILYSADNCLVRSAFEGEEGRIEAALEAIVCSVLHENRFEYSLRNVDVTTRTCGIIIPLLQYQRCAIASSEYTHRPRRIIPPRIQSRKLLSSHTVTPPRVLHTVSFHGNSQTLLF